MTVGDVRLTLLSDGYHRCDPLSTFVGSTREDWDRHHHLLDDRGRVVMTMGALLAELPTGERVLIDLTFGPRTIILAELSMEFWGGRLLSSLADAGLQPEDIDVVLYSHLAHRSRRLDDRSEARNPDLFAGAPRHGPGGMGSLANESAARRTERAGRRSVGRARRTR
jgi:hypothetical protein